MPVLRTAEGLTADCAVCKRWFNDGEFAGTSTELIHAMREADWCTHPVVCAACATHMRVWRNEGQPSDASPKRRKAEKAAAAAVRAAAPSRRRRSIDSIPAAPTSPTPTSSKRRRRTLI